MRGSMSRPMLVSIGVILFCFAPKTTIADLPVHCEREDVAGRWRFTFTALNPSNGLVPDNPFEMTGNGMCHGARPNTHMTQLDQLEKFQGNLTEGLGGGPLHTLDVDLTVDQVDLDRSGKY